MLVTNSFTVLINRLGYQAELAKFVGQTIGVQAGRVSRVWRIGVDGELSSVSSLITPTVSISYHSIKGVQIQGEMALLRVLSDIWRECDGLALFSELFGPVVGGHVLYAGETVLQRLQFACASSAEGQQYTAGVRQLHESVERLAGRVQRLATGY